MGTERPRELRVGGLTPLSCSDFPGALSAVIFCQGCPWRCGYCHNPHLLPARGPRQMTWDGVRKFLLRRRGLLDAVVFSGGEPTLQAALPHAVGEVRALGFKVGLHTAGMFPLKLKRWLALLDWIGMDIKAPFEDYERITGVPGSGARASASARLILASGIAYEFRTTVHSALLSQPQLMRIGEQLAQLGARCYAIQEFRARGADPDRLPRQAHLPVREKDCRSTLSGLFDKLDVRAAAA